MIAPLAKCLDWLAIQLVWGRRCRSLLNLRGAASGPRLEEALQFLKGPDFVPAESLPARLEVDRASSIWDFHFPTPRPGPFPENNIAYGRLYPCAGRWQQRPAVILLHGAGAADYYFDLPQVARRCNRAGINAATLKAPLQFQRRPRPLAALHWPDYLLEAQICYAQAIAEIRALLGWLLEHGSPAVAVWGGSYGGALAGLTACYEPRLAAAIVAVPGLDLNVFLSAAKHVVWPGLREELLKQRPACAALNQTVLNLANARPCIPKDHILFIEAIYDLYVKRQSVEGLWQAWGQPDIWRLPHSHLSRYLLPGLTARILRWLAPRLENPAVKPSP
jgi:pimeloyl-ACP methyl ester carboxylesterase